MDLSGLEGDIPIPISSSTYDVGQSHVHSIIHQNTIPPPLLHPHLSTEGQNNQGIKKRSLMVMYKECLKNHAASIGGNATDGCGEFMPNGEEGTLEALKCSACSCHRNFHRKEIEGDELNNFSSFRKLSIGGYNNNNYDNNNILMSRPTPHSMIMPLQTSELDEGYPMPPFAKKRSRTKFTSEQKAKMLSFAERAGWKLQKQEESVVHQLCQEIGVKRRVLKVWMHNNKHNFAKKAPLPSSNLNEGAHTGIDDSRGGF